MAPMVQRIADTERKHLAELSELLLVRLISGDEIFGDPEERM